MQLIEKCFKIIDRFYRLPNQKDELAIQEMLEYLGKTANAPESYLTKVKKEHFPASNLPSFPAWMLRYMERIISSYPGGTAAQTVQLSNGYKSEFYRSCAVNFLSENRFVYRLTDDCAEYIDDLGISRVHLSDINFPSKNFSIFFRMDGREFLIFVMRDEHGFRMTGINTVVDQEVETAFASHVLPISDDIDLRKVGKDEVEKWNLHLKLTEMNYDMQSRGLKIIQYRMRSFVLKFMFLYSTRMFEKKREAESVGTVKMMNEKPKQVNGNHHMNYVSLGVRLSQHMQEHRKIVRALGSERTWSVDMWPVSAYVRIMNGKSQHIESHWATRKAGKVTERPEVVVTL